MGRIVLSAGSAAGTGSAAGRLAPADHIGLRVPDFGRVHGDGDGTAHGRSAPVWRRYAEGKDGPGVQRPRQERYVFPFVVQEERDGTGLEIGDPLFRVAVHQARISRFEVEYSVGIGGEEVRGYLEPDACILQCAVEADCHDRASLDHDHLFVPIKRSGEARGREFDGTDAYRVAAGIHQERFGGFPVGTFVEYLPVRAAHAQDEVVRVRDLGRRPCRRTLAFDDPAEFSLSGQGTESEVVTRTECRRQRQECPQKMFSSHSYDSLPTGHRARPVRN